jgi:hypothetical protein
MTATGGNVITSNYLYNGSYYTSHTFTANGNFAITSYGTTAVELDMLVIAGGGSGGAGNGTISGGGGGAGALIQYLNIPIPAEPAGLGQNFAVTVGAGGLAVTGPLANGLNGNLSQVIVPTVFVASTGGYNVVAGAGAGGCGSATVGPNPGNGFSVVSSNGSTDVTTVSTGASGGNSGGVGSYAAGTVPSAQTICLGPQFPVFGGNVKGGGFQGRTAAATLNCGAAGGGGANGRGGANTTTAAAAGGRGAILVGWGYNTPGTQSLAVCGGGQGSSGGGGGPAASTTSLAYGGGIGSSVTPSPVAATAGGTNRGGGGGGTLSGTSGAGGSGLVIIRYRS